MKRNDQMCQEFGCMKRIASRYPQAICGITCGKITCVRPDCIGCKAMNEVPNDCLFLAEYGVSQPDVDPRKWAEMSEKAGAKKVES